MPVVIWAYVGAAAFVIGMGSGWAARDWRADVAARKEADARLASSEAARDDERLMQRSRARSDDAKNLELRAVGDRLADALERVRDRPARLPEPARAACQGATGAELSNGDAAVLERLAARADNLRTELGACQTREWDNYEALKRSAAAKR